MRRLFFGTRMTDLQDLHAEKWFWANFFPRFDALARDEQLLRIYDRFGPDVFRRSSVLEGFDSFLRFAGVRGQRCVEIGTCHGLTAIVLARYFDDVITIDVAPNDLKRVIAEYAGVSDRIQFLDVKDNAEKAEVIRGLQFDGAFCDGDHAKDTETDFALVARCGQVVFHEHWEPQPAVMELVRRLRARGGHVVTQGKWARWDGGA